MAQQKNNGNCFMCPKTANKTVMKNHILKEHNSGDEECYLIRAEGAYNKDYWIFFSVSLNADLGEIDTFLREIWCECCGHLSEFYIGIQPCDMSRELSTFTVGSKLSYEYDFGSTTEININILNAISRPKDSNSVVLLARNEPQIYTCERCKDTATHVNMWDDNKALCEPCIEKATDYDKDGILPITNSPRIGECDYCAEADIWVLDPKGEYPQTFDDLR